MSLMWSGPGRALQCHLDLFEKVQVGHRFLEQNNGKRVRASAIPPILAQRARLMSSMAIGPLVMLDGVTMAEVRDDPMNALSQSNVARANGLLKGEYELLNQGETHYVSHHVLETVAAAAQKAPDEMLFPTDLPSPRGLIVFEYPFLINDLHPETGEIVEGLHMPVRAIGWNRTVVHSQNPDGTYAPGEGVMWVTYADWESYNAIHMAAVRKLVDPEAYPYEGGQANGIWATDMSGWSFGKAWSSGGTGKLREDFDLGEVHDNVAILRRLLLAYFRWTWDRIIIAERADFGRPDRRRYQRVFNRKLEDGYVKVMRLRREVEMEARGERVQSDYVSDHAWIVGGHWKRVHYRSLGPARNDDGSFNHDSHRLKWIDPYLSGNPEGPLVVGYPVKAAVR